MLRRRFLGRLLVFCSGLFFTRCDKNTPSADRSFTSTNAFGHDHSITLTESAWTTPPAEGTVLITTQNLEHTHTIFLTYNELLTISQGGRVTVVSSHTGHEHIFTIVLKEG